MKTVIDAVNRFKGDFPSPKNTSCGWYINQIGDLGFYNCHVSSHEEFNQCVEDCSNNFGKKAKPLYTKQMQEAGELPSVGMECMIELPET